MPVSENPILQSFFAVAASVVLVGGTLILLTSTSPWTPPPQTENEPSTPDSARLSAEGGAALDLQFPRAPLASEQSRTGPAAEADETDRTYTASTGEQPDPQAPEQTLAPEASSADDDGAVAALGTPLDPETADGVDTEDSDTEAVIANDAAPAPENAADNAAAPEPDTGAPHEPEARAASEESNAATDQIADMLAGLPPRAIASARSDAATEEVADVLAATPPAPVVSDPSEAATPKVAAVLTPAPPLPARKPAEAPPAPKEAALPAPQDEKLARQEEKKPDAAPQNMAQQDAAQPRSSDGAWHPMALAPADTPSISLSKVPTARPSGAAYASTVWSALARHKPRAGQSGSATVVFAIGENGAVRGLKVGRSSGNTRIDQLALATVRGAAPFPPPPSGTASYSIRIDFH